ncbi:MAG: hypothetical protein OIF50_06940 [Flavobacteriaceae bacterium]|nr:hypothetical protein [Flavobacteriaceae bacterium]
MKNTLYFALIISTAIWGQSPDPASLIQVHTVNNAAELASITGANPGALIYNLEDNKLYSFNTVGWETAEIETPKFIDVFDSNSNYNLGSSYQIIQLNATRTSSGGIFNLANNAVTINEDGFYELHYGVAAKTNQWTYIDVALFMDGTMIPASETYSGSWYKKVTASKTMILQISSGTVISLRARKQTASTNDTVTVLDDGSYLVIKKIK